MTLHLGRPPRRSGLLSAVAITAMLPALSFADVPLAEAEAADEETRREITEVVVRGQSLRPDQILAPQPVQILAGAELMQRRTGTLGETLAGLPGVHLDNFGGGASRPVIRGQTLPRIEILSDGAALFDVASVSPDHAVTTDPLLLDEIRIIRGPVATLYGGNAMNGAVDLIDSKIPKVRPRGGFAGAVEARIGTGDDEKAMIGRVTAALGQFAFHVEGARRAAEDYNVPHSYGSDRLRDSFAENTSYSVGASWITSKGYAGAAYTRMESEYGLPGHSHLNGVCHTHGLDLHCEAHGGFEDPFGSSDSHTAYIKLQSDRVDIRADYDDLLPGMAHTRLRLSYTDYAHDEMDGALRFSRFTNKVWDGRFELTHKPVFGFTGTWGAQYTDGRFGGINVNNLHKAFPDGAYGFDGNPDYLTETASLFFTERRSFGTIDIEVAARKDWRQIDVTVPSYRITLGTELQALFAEWYGPNWREVIQGQDETAFRARNPTVKHDPFSASVGATWNMGKAYAVALSLGHTERAPSVRELYARGNNLATNSYELGLAVNNPILKPTGRTAEGVLEKTDAINLTFRKIGGRVGFEIGLFHQKVDDYVFARLIETETETGIPHNFLIYTAANTTFTGVDGQVSYNLSPAARVTVFGDYVRAELKSEADELPRIPPGRLGTRYNWDRGPMSASLEYYRTFGQKRVASYETRTDGYDMLNATAVYRFDLGNDRTVEIYARGTNLTDELAFVHTSFVKNQSPLRGRNIVFGVRHAF